MASNDTAVFSSLAFLLTLLSGVWLSRSGKPLKAGIFNLHKLIALAAVVLAATQVYGVLKSTTTDPAIIALLIVAALCIVALFATGALMSIDKPGYSRLLFVHRLAIVLSLLLWPAVLLLMSGGRS